jgi:D-alanine-D-alanine ligase
MVCDPNKAKDSEARGKRAEKYGKILVALADVVEEEKKRKDILDTSVSEYFIEKVFFETKFISEMLILSPKDFDSGEKLKEKINKLKPGCVYNRFEGFGEDSEKEADFARILEEMRVPFTGNTSYTLRLCLNKGRAKSVLTENGVKVPGGIVATKAEDAETAGLLYPLFVKPCCEDASLGIDDRSFVENKKELREALAVKLKEHPRGLVVEEFIPGNEYSVGFMDNGPYEVMGMSMINYAAFPDLRPFLTYSSKWMSDTPEYHKIIPVLNPEVGEALKKKIIDTATKAGAALKCRGVFRVDMRERDGELYVLDVNPNPDITPDSGFMRMSKARGYEYDDIVDKLLDAAKANVAK